jgi:hypothetical protein
LRIASVLNAGYYHFYQPYHASLHGYRSVFDYGAPDLGTHVDLYRAFAGKQNRQFALSSVALRLTVPPGESHMDAIEVEEIHDPLPRALLVPRAVIAPDVGVAGGYLASDAFNGREEVVLLDAPVELGRVGRGDLSKMELSGSLRTTVDRSTHVAFEVVSDRDAFLLVNDSWYPGWTVRVDWRDVEHYRANLGFRALLVPAGRHDVEFRYSPQGFVIGGWVTVVSVSLACLTLVLLRCRRQRNPGDGVGTRCARWSTTSRCRYNRIWTFNAL